MAQKKARSWPFSLMSAIAFAVASTHSTPMHAQILEFSALDGWHQGGQLEALSTFRNTCDMLEGQDWQSLCKLAKDVPADTASARAFFELFFRPVLVGQPPALFTGYYEPELTGSRQRSAKFAWPIYRRPPELRDGISYLSRASIESGALAGRGLEIAWINDPVDVFFLHIQGSGRIKLPDGSFIRVGYAGRNGHEYRSVGKELVRRGTLSMDSVSAQSISSWVRHNPGYGNELLNHNPSYIFFRELNSLPADKGPIGAMGRSITAMRSVAVDPKFTPLGAPVWVEKSGASPLKRLMIAQDTGGAIKGPQRADIFYGYGHGAGQKAGVVKDGGRMVQLLPIDLAYAKMGANQSAAVRAKE